MPPTNSSSSSSASIGLSQLQILIKDLIDLPSVLAFVESQPPDARAEMPPFPFPRELFPAATAFPPGMRFTDTGLAQLPPSMRATAYSVLEEMHAAQPPPPPQQQHIVPTRPRRSLWRRLTRRVFAPRRRTPSASASAVELRINAPAPRTGPPANASTAEEQIAFASRLLRVPDDAAADSALPPLHAAAKRGELGELCRLLEGGGCHVDAIIEGGETALHLAAEGGHTLALEYLLAAGAAIEGKTANGWRALHCAAQCEHPEAVALLLAHHADLMATTNGGVTPLHVAAFNGRLPSAKALVASGATVDALDADGVSPLENARHMLIDCPCRTEEVERRWGGVIALLERVAPMQIDERSAFARRSWHLFVSAALQDAADGTRPLDELKRLLRCYRGEAHLNAPDHDGSTALHAASQAGCTEAVRALVDAGARVDVHTNLLDTPLHGAAREGHLSACELLLACGADSAARNRGGATPLDLARRRKQREWEAVARSLE